MSDEQENEAGAQVIDSSSLSEAIDSPESEAGAEAPERDRLALPELALILCLLIIVAGSFSIIYWPLVQMMLRQFGATFGMRS